MPRTSPATILLTGASGQIGSQLCSLLRAGGHEVLAVDVRPNAQEKIELCDIRRTDHLGWLFESAAIRTVIHLAAVLPTAFRADPLAAAEVNRTNTSLLQQPGRGVGNTTPRGTGPKGAKHCCSHG